MRIDLDRYKAILCDLDGCLISGEVVLPGARDLVEIYADRLVAVSNNSTDTPATLSSRLAALGLIIGPDRIVLAGTTAVDFVTREFPGCRLAIFGSAAIKSYAEASGMVLVEDRADVVLLARDTGFSYDRLGRIVNMVRAGARLFVANLDGTHPAPDGGLVPETGALLAAVATCVPEVKYASIGKPEQTLFRMALDVAQARADEAIFIGDNLQTDGEGAKRMNMCFAHIGGSHYLTIADVIGPAAHLRLPPWRSADRSDEIDVDGQRYRKCPRP